jgi:inorganic pyrophosphatase
MIDDEQVDEKITAIPPRGPPYNDYKDITCLPRHTIDEVSHFFDVDKALEHSKTSVKETCQRSEALGIIEQSIARYRKTFPERS